MGALLVMSDEIIFLSEESDALDDGLEESEDDLGLAARLAGRDGDEKVLNGVDGRDEAWFDSKDSSALSGMCDVVARDADSRIDTLAMCSLMAERSSSSEDTNKSMIRAKMEQTHGKI